MHHYTGGNSSSTSPQGNGGGNGNNGSSGSSKINLTLFPEAQASVAAEKVTNIAPEALPKSGTVAVKARIQDVVVEEKQQLAVVRPGKSQPAQQVQVVQAVSTARPDVYQVSVVPGMPPVHIQLSDETKPALSQPSAVFTEVKEAQPGAVIPAGGNNTHDAIVHFPTGSGQPPLYVSVVEIMAPVNQKNSTNSPENSRPSGPLSLCKRC
ncbi:colicin-like bacteriocin tRNase domain-containing protein [Erwinia tasmaniensis]|uniref:colicin-like bacteriocin tRNase domain-containing protein n=1 Tax=Erwinia tasmaniensis TaxID=338565 RepID=UPI003A4D84C2